jgi:hypothetical protein
MNNKDFKNRIEKEIGCKIIFFGVLRHLNNDFDLSELGLHKDYFKHNIYIRDDLTYPETEYEYLNESYYLNSEFVNEMYLLYEYINKCNYGKDYHSWDISEIKIKLAGINENRQRKKILNKQLLKFKKEIKNNLLAKLYISEDNNLDINNEKFIPFIKETIFTFDDFYMSYLEENISLIELISSKENLTDKPHLYSWTSLMRTMKTVDFINEEFRKISELEKTPISKTKNKLTVPQRVLLLERVRNINGEVWDNLDNTKKASIISLITGNSKDTIRKMISKVDKKVKEDIEYVDSVLKSELG